MMRSRASSSRSLTEMIRDNPFLCAAFLAGLTLAALKSDIGSTAILQATWTVLGFGFHLTASWPEKLIPSVDGWLKVALSIMLGLLLYLIADVFWRHMRSR